MTVICYDGKTLAADSRCTNGTLIITDKADKLYQLKNVKYKQDSLLYMGMAGAGADFDLINHFLHSDKFPSQDIKHDTVAIIVGKKYVYKLEEDSGYLIQYSKNTKMAIGSGGTIGMTAMSLGLTAIEAVRHAIKLNSACGGKVRSVTLEEGRIK